MMNEYRIFNAALPNGVSYLGSRNCFSNPAGVLFSVREERIIPSAIREGKKQRIIIYENESFVYIYIYTVQPFHCKD